jgi:hypothetical protein
MNYREKSTLILHFTTISPNKVFLLRVLYWITTNYVEDFD